MARILVIDDSASIRTALEALCKRDGHEVLIAENGEAAAVLYNRLPPDLVITDILMPEKDGLQVLLDIRHKFPEAKIIAISGAAYDYLPTMKQMGAHHTIAKPFKSKAMLDAIHALLQEA